MSIANGFSLLGNTQNIRKQGIPLIAKDKW